MGTPAWTGTSATIARALRLLDENEEARLEQFAERLGMGARHLRRLFARHLGASPGRILRTRRLQLARQMIESSALPMSEVALAAGFASVRRFNEAVRAAFGRNPSELRRSGTATVEGLSLRLPFRPPFDWEAMLRFFQARAIAGVESVSQHTYRRAVRLDGAAGVVELSASERHLVLQIPLVLARAAFAIVSRIERLFDLQTDPSPISAHLGRDRKLRLFLRPGLRMPGAWDPFEMAVRAVVGQQISVAAATALLGRIVAQVGEQLATAAPGFTHLFPTPEALAAAELRGLPAARVATIRALATAVRDGSLTLDGASGLDEAVEKLVALPGIGPWTAQLIAMRGLGEPDAFPIGDLGLRRALGLSPTELLRRAENWRPWRAYAAAAIWMSG